MKHRADPDASDRNTDRIVDPEHAPGAGPTPLAQALVEKEHGATGDRTVGVLVAVLDAEGALGKFRGHPQESGDNHPERRARAAYGYRDRDMGDVANPNGARDRGGERLKM